jgi:lipoprotein-anchoring transpeptidase ErfK/SrfK
MLVRYRDSLGDTTEISRLPSFDSREDSLDWVRWRDRANDATRPLLIVVSLFDRTLHVMRSGDTVLRAPIAVASGMTLEYAGRSWTFKTPRGERRVLRKVTDPVWSPPDWLYAEVASAYGLKLARLDSSSWIKLQYGYRLTVRNGIVGVVTPDTRRFVVLPVDEHIVFNSTLYIPPHGTLNRRVPGELGRFALDMGSGYLIHGTPDERSIGRAVTHGCIRLADADIEWMYENVPVGTPVIIY